MRTRLLTCAGLSFSALPLFHSEFGQIFPSVVACQTRGMSCGRMNSEQEGRGGEGRTEEERKSRELKGGSHNGEFYHSNGTKLKLEVFPAEFLVKRFPSSYRLPSSLICFPPTSSHCSKTILKSQKDLYLLIPCMEAEKSVQASKTMMNTWKLPLPPGLLV